MQKRLLLADDDAAFREQLTTLLGELVPDGEIVATVADGHAAVAEAMAHSPSIVVIDYAMPGPDGRSNCGPKSVSVTVPSLL